MFKGAMDRIAALILIVIGIIYIIMALRLEIIFFNGPVGPHHWGAAVGGLMIFCSILLLLRPSDLSLPENHGKADVIKLMMALSPLPLILIGYSLILPFIGFLISTFIMLILVIRLFDGKWIGAAIASISMTAACYGLFDVALGLSLPLGSFFR